MYCVPPSETTAKREGASVGEACATGDVAAQSARAAAEATGGRASQLRSSGDVRVVRGSHSRVAAMSVAMALPRAGLPGKVQVPVPGTVYLVRYRTGALVG